MSDLSGLEITPVLRDFWGKWLGDGAGVFVFGVSESFDFEALGSEI